MQENHRRLGLVEVRRDGERWGEKQIGDFSICPTGS